MDASRLLHGIQARWLVTGAAGFIGSHLAESLALAGQDVVAVDNFVTGKRENLAAVSAGLELAGTGVAFLEGDIRDSALVSKAMEGVDYVLHQAAIGSVPRSIEHPLPTFASNVEGFMQVMTAARDAQVKAFVYASSSAVYGDHPALPKREGNEGNLLSPYAASKAADELFAGVYARCYDLKTIGLRYFNVFGARQDPDGAYAAVIPRWISAMLRGEDIFINGDGLSSRDFCFIDNVVQANIRAALCAPARSGGIALNIAAGEQTTLNDLFRLLGRLLAQHEPAVAYCSPTLRDFRPGDIRHSLASIGEARSLIGYAPSHSLEEGLRASLGWYLERYGVNCKEANLPSASG